MELNHKNLPPQQQLRGFTRKLQAPVDLSILSQKGSLFVTRPTLMTYIASNEDLYASAGALFEVVGTGMVKVEVNQTFALKDAALAHRALESRTTTGSTVLLP